MEEGRKRTKGTGNEEKASIIRDKDPRARRLRKGGGPKIRGDIEHQRGRKNSSNATRSIPGFLQARIQGKVTIYHFLRLIKKSVG